MKNDKNADMLRVTINQNYFIRTVICMVASQVAVTLIWALCLAIGLINIKEPVCQIFSFVGGITALVQIISIFSVVKEINSLHKTITDAEDEIKEILISRKKED